ncbi:uncharacterized protein LOC112343985, partial [Selaginella moellendorffii]|uniref:uncharacterized protein LOC112343985 n=1 Tax=Selaginella moellendorffii TaxID=88036 RepID=UPI000D1C8F2D
MYATSTKLTIASSDFAKSFVINLPVEFPGCEEGLETHVDALRWISPQSIVISYVQSEDDEEIACPLLVLSASHGQQLDEACTECSALAVTRRFPAIESTIIPPMNSPYMLVQNLEPWKIVLTTCRRSIDAHVGLLGWRSEGVCSLDLSDDLWRADIPMFDSSSDNALTGLAID